MSIHELHLTGCAPTPLAWYLKAIGILRLVSEQVDPGARGAWTDEHFVLWSKFDRDALERFFAEEYAPTPMVSPWNKGSGFMGSAEGPVEAIEGSTAKRLKPFRDGIAAARVLTQELSAADRDIRGIKAETKVRGMSKFTKGRLKEDPGYKRRLADADKNFQTLKADLIPTCRRSWRGLPLDWLEAALVLSEANEAKFPSILGTGGNDGRLDMTNNAMQRIAELFDLENGTASTDGRASLPAALWGSTAPGQVGVAIGQFLPGGAGGANSSNGPMGDSQVNRWDFLFALEGALAFRAHAVRKLGTREPVLAAAPFAAYSHATGYGSASTADEGGRGEQWMPLWSRPTSWPEVQSLFSEGRAQLGRSSASRPLDLVRAFTRLGAARGINQFVRYGYIERNGQSNLAVALDRINVNDSPESRLLDDIAPWIERLLRRARDKSATARLQKVERQLSSAVFDALRKPAEPRQWQAVLIAAAEAERLLVPGAAPLAGPIPALQPAWLTAADDGTPEFRLAVALGLARISKERGKTWSIRRHFIPTDDRGRLKTSGGNSPKVFAEPAVVMEREPIDALLALAERRLIEAETGARRRLDLVPSFGAGAALADLALFIEGSVDDRRIMLLARAFAAIRVRQEERRLLSPARGERPEDSWLALRLAHLPKKLSDGRTIPVDLAIIRRLRSGDAEGAVQAALRRLHAAGLNPPLRFGLTDPVRARRWGAALAFPITKHTTETIVRSLFPTSEESAHGR